MFQKNQLLSYVRKRFDGGINMCEFCSDCKYYDTDYEWNDLEDDEIEVVTLQIVNKLLYWVCGKIDEFERDKRK